LDPHTIRDWTQLVLAYARLSQQASPAQFRRAVGRLYGLNSGLPRVETHREVDELAASFIRALDMDESMAETWRKRINRDDSCHVTLESIDPEFLNTILLPKLHSDRPFPAPDLEVYPTDPKYVESSDSSDADSGPIDDQYCIALYYATPRLG